MVLVRKALALFEADEAKKENGAETAEPIQKRRRGRPAKAEKAQSADPSDLRNVEVKRTTKEDGGNG